MAKTKKRIQKNTAIGAYARTQKIMIASLAVFLSVSVVFVLYERLNAPKHAITEQSARTTREHAQGVALEHAGQTKGAMVVDYRSYARSSSSELFSIIDRLERGGEVEEWEIHNVYSALLAMVVPEMYKDLHFRLVRLAVHVEEKHAADDFAYEQRRLLLEAYPWLSNE